MKKKFLYSIFVISMLITSVIFAGDADYSVGDIDGRETVVIDGVTYIAQGEPVIVTTNATGMYTNENFIDANGEPHTGRTNMIVKDEDGRTGNIKQQSKITFEDSTMGNADNQITMDVLAEPILAITDSEGNITGYNLPTAEIGEYTGKIYNSPQEYIDELNETGRLDYTYDYYFDDDGVWTIEKYNQVFNNSLNNKSIFYDETFISNMLEAKYVNGKLIYEGVTDAAIKAVLGFAIDKTGDVTQLIDFYKLYAISGEDIDTIEEILDVYIPTDTPPTPPEGEWSASADASVSASVSAVGNYYNISQGIPTSEQIKGTITASDMSWGYTIVAKNDSVSYQINGITVKWDPYQVKEYIYEQNESGDWVKTDDYYWVTKYRYSDTVNVIGTYTTHYFHVQYAEMNVRTGGSVSNDATGSLGGVGPSGLSGTLNRGGGIEFDEGRMSKGAFTAYGNTKSDAIASAQGTIRDRLKYASRVHNDTLSIAGAGLSGKTEFNEEFKGTPYIYPSSLSNPGGGSATGGGHGVMIPSYRENGEYGSSASATYEQVGGFDGRATYKKSASAPSVFVHTPVTAQMTINNIGTTPFINQKVVQDSNVKYLMLDEEVHVNIPINGTHLHYQGYGSRAYNSNQAVPGGLTNWGKLKDVKFSFDVYYGGTLIPAGLWLSDMGLATAQLQYKFVIPVWAEEGPGTITVRVVAENANSYTTGSTYNTGLVATGANLDSSQYVAETTIPVEIIGKIYDLRISGTNDPGWENIKGKEGAYVTSTEFPFGQAGQNKMTQYKFAPKLGYVVEFDFKTKGIKTDNVDVSIQPEGFYFVGKNGGTAQEVDLYFQTTNKQYVKIALNNNNSDIIVNLSNKFMKVIVSELIDSRLIMGTLIGLPYTYNENVRIGKLPELQIPEKLRLCYNNFAEYANKLYGKPEGGIAIDAANGLDYSVGKYDKVTDGINVVKASVGHWYAGYRLPSSTIAVPKGTTANDLARNPDLAKKNGYILVKFDIIGKNGTEDYLRYTGPEAINESTGNNTGEYDKDPNNEPKQWQDPDGTAPNGTNPNQPVTLPNGKSANVPDGTVLIFETDLRANNDYEVIGTH